MKDVTPQTSTTLAFEIELLPQSWFRDELLQAVVKGSYHEIHSCRNNPRLDLVKRLSGLGYRDLAKRVHEGEFSEGPCAIGTCLRCDELRRDFDKRYDAQTSKKS